MTLSDTAEPRASTAGSGRATLRDARATVTTHRSLNVWIVALIVGALTALMYGPPVAQDGFYYDDWGIAAAISEGGHNWIHMYQGCTAYDTGDRPGACAYHTTIQWLLGTHVSSYHIAAAITLFLTAVLLYLLLRRCRFPSWMAGASTALFVVFPGSDSTRLWPTADNLAWALLLYIAAVLVGLAALQRHGWRATVVHLVAGLMLLWVALTYDGMIPVIALSGIFYYLARRDRQALVLAGVDLLIAAGYGIWRLKFAGIQQSADLTVGRSSGQLITREAHLLKGGWNTLMILFLPSGWVGIAVLAAALFTIATAAILRPGSRRPIARWTAVAAGCAVYAMISLSAYITANDYYVPDPGSLFNRLNIAAAPAYCLGFVALLTALGVALAALAPTRIGPRRASFAAAGVALLLGALVVITQYNYSRTTQDAYAQSWKTQAVVLRGIRIAIRTIPDRNANIVSFGEPVWEQRFIPVFAAWWDLRGAMAEKTRIHPLNASPFLLGWGCGPAGVTDGTTTFVHYQSTQPLWFIDATTHAAFHITSQASCQTALKHLTPLPFFDPAGL